MGMTVYVGKDGVAKSVKAIYVGVNGVARYIMRPPVGVYKYGGTVEELSVGRRDLSCGTVGNYALFAGGTTSIEMGVDIPASDMSSNVDTYDSSLVKTRAADLSIGRYRMASATIGNYIIFMGGFTSEYDASDDVDVYDSYLTKTKIISGTIPRRGSGCGCSTIKYALFAGGYYWDRGSNDYMDSEYVYAYDSNLTMTGVSRLEPGRRFISSAKLGDYAIFAGGGYRTTSGITFTSAVDVYDSTLTRKSASSMSIDRYALTGTTVNSYALFAGGMNRKNAQIKVVDAYDLALTRFNAADLTKGSRDLSSTTLNKFALFSAANPFYSNGVKGLTSIVDVYDSELNKTTATPFNVARYCTTATTVGNYALFCGGYSDAKDSLNEFVNHSDVDVYSC